MKRYIRKFQEADSLSDLTDTKIVDELIQFIQDNPFPKDHEGLHKWAENKGYEPDKVEQYAYAIVSCFVCGGNYIKKKKDFKDFDKSEIDMGLIVEAEHTYNDSDNKVVKYISEYMQKRIAYDHLSDNPEYYSQAKEGKLQIEELK